MSTTTKPKNHKPDCRCPICRRVAEKDAAPASGQSSAEAATVAPTAPPVATDEPLDVLPQDSTQPATEAPTVPPEAKDELPDVLPQDSVEAATAAPTAAPVAKDEPPDVLPQDSVEAATAAPTEAPEAEDEAAPQGSSEAAPSGAPVTEVPPVEQAATATEPTSPTARPKLTKLTVEELLALHLELIGRASSSSDKAYLVWRLRQAEKGRIPIGPRQPRRQRRVEGEGGEPQAPQDFKVLPLRMEVSLVSKLDEARVRLGLKSRMELLRLALQTYLTGVGEEKIAALFGPRT